ncbi:hypothetical protein RvY_10124 [Ramazzottius varieornatus]|uniref:Uncharacterized protein n=1 Tax=Ramazzottius varieornatus TaxID=947166 RepID=A0A1D1VKR6_RAMVA|nr:hypothetical protein RvY_10124 [Ramazzottius varieornatus]
MASKVSRRTTSQISKQPTATGNGVTEEHETNGIEKPPPLPTGDLRLSLTQESPSLKYLDAIRMSRLIDKLILLDITNALPGNLSHFGLSRDYFLLDKPGHAVVRFQVFASLSVWMIGQLGIDLPPPTERDDPNITVQKIVEALRKLNIQSDVAPHRLKSALGPEVVNILYELATECLKRRPSFAVPDLSKIKGAPVEDIEEDIANDDDDEQYEAIPLFDWEQEEVMEDLTNADGDGAPYKSASSENAEKERAAEEWRLEADRLGPLFGRQDGALSQKGWSERVKRLEACRQELLKNVEFLEDKMSGVGSEISRSVEKIQNREKYISVNNRQQVDKYKEASMKLKAAREKYEMHNAEVEITAKKLAEVTAEFEKLKRRVEEKGSTLADRTAAASMKAAIKRMKEEMGMYNIQCAIAEMRLQHLTEAIQNAEIDESLASFEGTKALKR